MSFFVRKKIILLFLFYFRFCFSIIAAGIKDDPVRHSCDTNQECEDRLNPIYPPYTFVCCTTVSCNENYSEHYTVTSGCTPVQTCEFSVTVNEDSFFATKMEKKFWEKFDSNLIGNCNLTRQKIEDFPSISTVSNKESKREISLPQKSQINCNCSDDKQCCVHVNCVDDVDSSYKVNSVCQDVCPLFFTHIYEQFNFYFPLDQWKKQEEYKTSESILFVENSCQETRNFIYWLLNQKIKTISDYYN